MKKVLPKCQCGADVMYDVMYESIYDEAGSLICHKPTDVVFNDVCDDCFDKAHLAQLPFIQYDDELPF